MNSQGAVVGVGPFWNAETWQRACAWHALPETSSATGKHGCAGTSQYTTYPSSLKYLNSQGAV